MFAAMSSPVGVPFSFRCNMRWIRQDQYMPGPTSLTTSSSAAAVTAFWSPRIPAFASAMVVAPVYILLARSSVGAGTLREGP